MTTSPDRLYDLSRGAGALGARGWLWMMPCSPARSTPARKWAHDDTMTVQDMDGKSMLSAVLAAAAR
jgi:hypothetical protein